MFEVAARVEAERSGSPFLEYRDGGGRERIVVFAPAADVVTVGRRSSSDLVIDWDDQVSRLHARFERVAAGWELVDDGLSSNGTFVNERRLNGRSPLRPGDVLRFGATQMTFHAPRQVPTPVAAQPPAPVPAQPPLAPSPRPAVSASASPVALSSTQRRVLAALCRPYKGGNRFASPATDEQIAEDLILSVGEVRTHLRVLCAKLGIGDPTAQNARVRLVEAAFAGGHVSEGDL
jgi:FHA domain